MASDAETAEAIDQFHDAYRARGFAGEEKLLERDYAMSELARLQHPDVVAALAKIAKGSNQHLRILAVLYLGQQTLLPGLAGPAILKAMKKDQKEPIALISGLQSLGNLRHLSAAKEIKRQLKHRDFAVKKAAIMAVGRIGEMRLWKEIFKLAGVSVRSGDDVSEGANKQGKKEEVVSEGYSYEGAEERVDWGLSDNSAEIAEAKRRVEAKIAANKAKAMAGSGSRGGGGGGGVGTGATGRGGVARDPKELLPYVLRTVKDLTGEEFSHSKELAKWVRKNRQLIRDRVKELDLEEKAQKAAAKNYR